MGFPHWLMIGGALLVVIGWFGTALKKDVRKSIHQARSRLPQPMNKRSESRDGALLELSRKRKLDPQRRAAVNPISCPYQPIVRLDNRARDG
jgi:hypothetical protein